MEIIKEFKRKKKFTVHYINSLQLKSASHLYTRLHESITRNTIKNSKVSKDRLEKLFETGVCEGYENDGNKTKLLVIDELDYLMTKSQSVLYSLFNWPHLPKVSFLSLQIV